MESDRQSRAEIERTLCDVVAQTLSIPRDRVRPSSHLHEDLVPEGFDLVNLGVAIDDAFPTHRFDLDPFAEIFLREFVTLSDIAGWIDQTWS